MTDRSPANQCPSSGTERPRTLEELAQNTDVIVWAWDPNANGGAMPAAWTAAMTEER